MHRLARAAAPAVIALIATFALTAPARAQPGTTYRVTVTNLTQHQVFSSPVVAVHRLGSGIFRVGGTVEMPFWLMAEDGIADDLADELVADPGVYDVAVAPEFLMPGHSVTLTVEARGAFQRLSAVGMLVTTNDAFFGIDGHALPGPWLQRLHAPVYDAGTEENTEDCAFVPGPPCHSELVRDTDGAEGTVSIHPGIHGIGDLDPALFDWRNPVAEIRVVRVSP